MAVQDPPPRFTDTDDALDRLAAWRRRSDLVDRQRDPLVHAALNGPLGGHGRLQQALVATGITAQTLRRIKGRTDLPPRPATDTSAEVDWDAYADYLDTEAAAIREALDSLPSRPERAYTLDDLRAEVLRAAAERIRDTPVTDADLWELTVQLRAEAADILAPNASDQDRPDPAREAGLAEHARILGTVADQISRFRTEGEAAFDALDARLLAHARDTLAPPSGRPLYPPH